MLAMRHKVRKIQIIWKSHRLEVLKSGTGERFMNFSHFLCNWRVTDELSIEQHANICLENHVKIFTGEYLSRGVLPENLRRGPYAVVDERCDLLLQQFAYFFYPSILQRVHFFEKHQPRTRFKIFESWFSRLCLHPNRLQKWT